MNCKEYQQLTPLEKRNYIGELIHSCMNDSNLFKEGLKIISKGYSKKLFDGVTINPIQETYKTEDNLEKTFF